jgi:hypothetical protein
MQLVEDRQAITITNEGKKIFGILHWPINVEGPVPAIVICPGFAGNKSGKFRIFVEISRELAKNGIAVLRFDYRGTGDSEGDFAEITIESQVSDSLAGINFLKTNSKINSDKIGLLGRSLGGMIAILAAVRAQTIHSLALWAPVFSSEQWKKILDGAAYTSTNQLTEGVLRFLPSNIPAIPSVDFLKQFFQVDLKKELETIQHVPLLHIHGNKDEFVKYEHALAYKSASQTNAQAVFIELPNSNHDFSLAEERKIAINETTQWFIKTLIN